MLARLKTTGLIAALLISGIALLARSAEAQAPAASTVTFNKDIAPILQRSCQQCHRPNSIAPMSLLNYQQVRPYARAIKPGRPSATRRGVGRDAPVVHREERGRQKFKEDISLSDAEIAKIAEWVDNGAPEGNPADLPEALKFADSSVWALGKPDLIVSSPKVLVKGISSDWWPIGETPTGMTESRFARAAEVKEFSDLKPGTLRSTAGAGTYLGQGKTALVVFHHANVNVVTAPGQEFGDGEGGGGLTLHEVGRNGDVFLPEAGKSVPAGSAITFNAHLHSPGIAGADPTLGSMSVCPSIREAISPSIAKGRSRWLARSS